MKNNSAPFFSIIIPCYNAASFVNKALHALELQTFSDFEIILVDDCSTDNTYEYCRRWAENSTLLVTLLRNKENSGPGASRSWGLQHAKGRFVGFCDSDDWYEPDLLELAYSKIQSEKAELVFFDFYRCFSDNHRMKVGSLSNFCKCKKKEDFIALSTDSLCSLLIKKTLLEKVPMANLYNAEDVVTVPLFVAEAERISFLNRPLYNYQYRLCSLSTHSNKRVVNNFLKAYSFLVAHKKQEYDAAFEFHCIKLVIYGAFYNAIRCGMKRKILRRMLDNFEKYHSNWRQNPFLKYLPKRKRFWMFCINHNCFSVLHIYCKLHSIYLQLRLKKFL